jgi:hypothetical protein
MQCVREYKIVKHYDDSLEPCKLDLKSFSSVSLGMKQISEEKEKRKRRLFF